MAAPRKSPRNAPASAPVEQARALQALALLDAPADAPEASPAVALEAVIDQAGCFTEVIRQAGASSLEQSRAAFTRLKEVADEAAASIEAARKVSDEGVETLRLKALESIKTSTDANFDFARALAGCTSFADAFALQNEHARKQVEAFNAQAKEYAGLVQKVANDAMSPLTATFGKGFGLTA